METQCFTVTHGYQATVTYFLKKTTPAMTEVTQTCFTVTHGYQATVTYFLKKTTPAMTEVTQTCFTVTHRGNTNLFHRDSQR